MNVKDLERLLKGEAVSVLDNTGEIILDLEVNMFLAISTLNTPINEGYALNLHETIEEAIQEIKEYNDKLEG